MTAQNQIEIRQSWTIASELRVGTLTALVNAVAAYRYDSIATTTALRFSIETTTALKAGPATIRTQSKANGRLLLVSFATSHSGDLVTATVEAMAPPDELAPSQRCLPPLRPNDLLPYRGGRPGLAEAFEIRPLPRQSATHPEAWIRNRTELGSLEPTLVALDAWTRPDDRTHRRLRRRTDRNGASNATITVTEHGRSAGSEWWFLSSNKTATGYTHDLLDLAGQLLAHADIAACDDA